MDSCRFYGEPPYTIAVVHGGPGAPGSAMLLAQGLAGEHGVIEPMQSRHSVLGPGGQVEELHDILHRHALLPAILVGHSWGAMLSWCLAAHYPDDVGKLVLVSSGLFEDRMAGAIMRTRFERLDTDTRHELMRIFENLVHAETPGERDRLLAAAAPYFVAADTYASNILDSQHAGTLPLQYDLHKAAWAEMRELRSSGNLLDMGRVIRCPVVAIHGDYDPHPAESIEASLRSVVDDFQFHLLARCGHYPWLEEYAREPFFKLLHEIVSS